MLQCCQSNVNNGTDRTTVPPGTRATAQVVLTKRDLNFPGFAPQLADTFERTISNAAFYDTRRREMELRWTRGFQALSWPPRDGFPSNALPAAASLISRAFPLFLESRKRSILLFLRNCGRKTAAHFCWNCSRLYPGAGIAFGRLTTPLRFEPRQGPADQTISIGTLDARTRSSLSAGMSPVRMTRSKSVISAT